MRLSFNHSFKRTNSWPVFARGWLFLLGPRGFFVPLVHAPSSAEVLVEEKEKEKETKFFESVAVNNFCHKTGCVLRENCKKVERSGHTTTVSPWRTS